VAARVTDLGADDVIDYRAERLEERDADTRKQERDARARVTQMVDHRIKVSPGANRCRPTSANWRRPSIPDVDRM